jgi:hypothetical protein
MTNRLKRQLLKLFILLVVTFPVVLSSSPSGNGTVYADEACCLLCDDTFTQCEQNCFDAFSPCGSTTCAIQLFRCRQACEAQHNNCHTNCGSCL